MNYNRKARASEKEIDAYGDYAARDLRRLMRRGQWAWICATAGILGVFMLQVITYCSIDDGHRELFTRYCGNDCRNADKGEISQFSTLGKIRSPFTRNGANDEEEVGIERILDERRKSTQNRFFPDSKSMLIVGGSDGSGTRAVVDVLRELGTTVVYDDPETFDVHASEVVNSFQGRTSSGWPTLIERFVSNFGREGFFRSTPGILEMKSPSENYQWPPPVEALENSIQKDIAVGMENDVNQLIGHWNDKFVSTINDQNSQKSRVQVSTRDVTYAIKAPASMLVLPLFACVYQQLEPLNKRPLKFLHVVRDGRDVALSNNQSPVVKFYNLTYPLKHPRRETLASFILSMKESNANREVLDEESIMHAKAMQLWNDWNINIYLWANDPINHRSIEYLRVRSEDFLIAGSRERLDALTALAQFVGSTATEDELCTLGEQNTKDYGQSSHVTSRTHILHREGGGGDMDIFARWKLQDLDAMKRKQQQQIPQQQPRDNQSDTFAQEYSGWKTVVEATLAKGPEEEVLLYVFDSLIRKGEELVTKGNETGVSEQLKIELQKFIQKMKNSYRERRSKIHNGLESPKGMHFVTAKKSSPTIQNRYGKWKTLLEGKNSLREFFFQEGGEGLKLFGYHPRLETRYTSSDRSKISRETSEK